MESLGFSSATWISPIFVLAFSISILSAVAALHWSPVARASFESRVKELIWDDTSMLSGQQLMVPFKKNQTMNRLFEGENSILNRDISSVSISIGVASANEWSNVRIVGWEGDQPLGVLHAKKSKVIKDRQSNQVSLYLEKVDFESLGGEKDNPVRQSQFVSFDKWKEPLILELNSKIESLGNKTTSILDAIKIWLDGSNMNFNLQGLSKHFSKYASVSMAPICLSPFLIFTALRKRKKRNLRQSFHWCSDLYALLYNLYGNG